MIVLGLMFALVFISLDPVSSDRDLVSVLSDIPSEEMRVLELNIEDRKQGRGKSAGRPHKGRRPVGKPSKTKLSGKASKRQSLSKPSKGKPGRKPSKSEPSKHKPKSRPPNASNGIRPPGSHNKINENAINNDACNGNYVYCDFYSRYRTITGVCNNLQSPYLGAAYSMVKRFLSSEYDDCKGEPTGGFALAEERFSSSFNYSRKGFSTSKCSKTLPNVREVSSTFHPDLDIPENYLSLMVMQFGQFLDHDLALTPEVEIEHCCENPLTRDCFPIYVPRTDSFYSTRDTPQSCLEFTRSDAFCDASSEKREQYSIVTSFVDGSQIYGSDEELARKLREGEGGRLKINSDYSREMLPEIDGKLKAGDIRALDMPGLATMHTLFLREHNRVADLISYRYFAYGYADDEEIYQRARRIVIAEYQSIVYGEYLPIILGNTAMQQYGLNVPQTGYSDYNSWRDPSLVHSFSTAAFRFGHSLIQGLVNMADVNNPNSVLQSYQLRENFFNMDRYLSNNGLGMDQIIAGLVGQEAQTMDRFVTEDVTNFLFLKFEEDTGNIGSRDFGGDLVARNLQRGRDHGLPGYNKYRSLCGMKSIRSMRDKHRPNEISKTNWRILGQLYKSPDDIDLFAGGLGEIPVSDGLTGPTFTCIKSSQFGMLKEGDRFFFAHEDQPGRFNPDHLWQLKKRTLRDIICQNTEVARMRPNAFLLTGQFSSCNFINDLDI